jgi:REP element-mobilizing transposase RayT
LSPVEFTGEQALAISRGFKEVITKSRYTVYACAILPFHVHMVLARCPYRVEQSVRLLKAAATTQLMNAGLHPFADSAYPDGTLPSPWSRNCWKVFLNADEDIVRSIGYVEANPERDGKRKQFWSFVTPFVSRAIP